MPVWVATAAMLTRVPAWCRSVRACSTCWWRLVGSSGVCLADEGVEAVDEFAVAFGFAGPASDFGVSGEELGGGALRGEDGRVGVVGAVAGAGPCARRSWGW